VLCGQTHLLQETNNLGGTKMPVVDLGVNYDDIKHMDEFPTVPDGAYDFTVKEVTETQSQGGRPMLKWKISTLHPDTGQDVNIFHNTVLPWIPPGETEMSVSGCGMLVAIAKAVGLPWTGGSLNTEDYVGRTGNVNLRLKTRQIDSGQTDANGKKVYIDDPSGKETNEIVSFNY